MRPTARTRRPPAIEQCQDLLESDLTLESLGAELEGASHSTVAMPSRLANAIPVASPTKPRIECCSAALIEAFESAIALGGYI